MSVPSFSFSQRELIQVLDETAVQGCLAWRAWAELEVHEDREICRIGCADPFPIFNVVLKARMEPEKADRRIDYLISLARQKNTSLGWYTTPCTRPSDLGERLLSRGFVLGGITAGMAASLSALKDDQDCGDRQSSVQSGLAIEEVRDLDALKIWSRIMTSVYEFPESAANTWFRLNASLGLGEDRAWHHYLAYLDGKPLATSSIFLGSDAAMLANVATVADYRRLGIGTAVALRALRDARARGYSTAIICSSDLGKNVYLRMGFEEICELYFYLWSPGLSGQDPQAT
ncbi:MAG: GNAT family N-acetyltransferase [Methanotrichaceae archaeon]|nr:GNAT family N-acetyltransferase [Methanotrichaceae archaeon]